MNYFESQRGHDMCNLLFRLLRDLNEFLENEPERKPRNPNLPLELQLRLDIQKTMSGATGDYSSRILSVIEDDVVADVMECSSYTADKTWTDGDITLAIGRVLCSKLGITF